MNPDPGAPPPAEGPRRLLRRVPLLVILLLLGWLFLGERPREIRLVYDLPDEPAPARVDVRLADRGGTTVAAIRWGGGDAPARDRQAQTALLAPGRYDLDATLIFPGGARREIRRTLEVNPDDEEIVLHLR